jgi:ABC-2 type transport system ATP-binding protein
MQESAIRASELSVVRGGKVILNRLSFGIAPGKLTGLIGPSGSGKTTLIRSIVGAQKITGGRLRVLGQRAGSRTLRSQIGYVTQDPAVYGDLTVRQNLRYFAAILGKGKVEVRRVTEQVDLQGQTEQLVNSLSGGQHARVSLAVALLGDARVLVLDEPTVGLDPLLRQHLWQLFKLLAADGRTLLISSHVMDEAEKCDDVMLLREGKVLSHGSKQALLQKTETQTVEAAFLKLVEGSSDSTSSPQTGSTSTRGSEA